MTSNNEEKAQDAADRIKAAALSAAKGLSRAQAERAATAAARNVNAYGQKEEGPSRWQERKEAKRQMYLMSTEKAVKLGVRKDLKNTVSSTNGVSSQCQKCYEVGHWTYECKNERVYISRPSRTQILKNPKLNTTVSAASELENPDIGIEEKGVSNRKKEKGEKSQKKSKRKYQKKGEKGQVLLKRVVPAPVHQILNIDGGREGSRRREGTGDAARPPSPLKLSQLPIVIQMTRVAEGRAGGTAGNIES